MKSSRIVTALLLLALPGAALAKTKSAKPKDAKPADAKPADAKPKDAKPADAKPAGKALGGMDTVKQGNLNFKKLLAKKAKVGSDEEKKLAAQLTAQMRDLFDIKDLTRRALVDHQKEISDAQLTELSDTLQGLVQRAYLKQLRSNLTYDVDYLSEAPQGDSTLVKTVIKAQHKGKPTSITVDYLLHQDGGKWSVYDVITDDVSMLRNYRSQFNRIIKNEKVEGLLAKMKKKLADGDQG